MKKNYLRLLFFIIIPVLLFSCNNDDNFSPEAEALRINEKVNAFINNKMDSLYLWNDMMPDARNLTLEPTTFFDKLLYTREDKWSFITDDYEGLMASFAGVEKSYGYSIAIGEDGGVVYAAVQFVYPNSPAGIAGLKRGDIIYKIDGEFFNAENINKLFSADNISITYGNFVDGISEENATTIDLTAAEFTANPVLKTNVIEKGDKKIGYLCLTKFVSNPEARFQLDEVFANFKTSVITDLVLDLRYNRGGGVTTAQHLSSLIAPENVVDEKQLLITQTYNKLIHDDLIASGDTDLFELRFIPNTNNVNMTHIYVLTGTSTASASELTITGLQPYMEVTKIGATTAGKYAASITVRPNTTASNEDIQNWAIQPIVLKYANANGFTDFRYGLTPDFEVADQYGLTIGDDIVSNAQLGDENEALLKKAIEEITGIVAPTVSKSLKTARTKSVKVLYEISSKYDRFYNTTNFNEVIIK